MVRSAAALFLPTLTLSNHYEGRCDEMLHRRIEVGPGLQSEPYLVALIEAIWSEVPRLKTYGDVLDSLDD